MEDVERQWVTWAWASVLERLKVAMAREGVMERLEVASKRSVTCSVILEMFLRSMGVAIQVCVGGVVEQ